MTSAQVHLEEVAKLSREIDLLTAQRDLLHSMADNLVALLRKEHKPHHDYFKRSCAVCIFLEAYE